MKKILLLMIALLTGSAAIYAQSVHVTSVDPSQYPDIKVGYRLYDNSGAEIRSSLQGDDIIVQEYANGAEMARENEGPECDVSKKAFSAIIVLDFSGSMDEPTVNGTERRYQAALKAVKSYINAMDPSITEVAILRFSCSSFIISEFSNDKDELLQTLDDFNEAPAGNTNYNAAFIANYDDNRTKSALHFCRPDVAKYKPVVIFLTDGAHTPKCQTFKEAADDPWRGRFMISKAVNELRANDAYVFVLQFGNDLVQEDPNNPDPVIEENLSNLRTLAGVEGDADENTFDQERISNMGGLENVYNEIYTKAATLGTPAPCTFMFESDCDGGDASLSMITDDGPASTSFTYTVPDDLKPILEAGATELLHSDDDPTVPDTYKVKLTARNNYVDLDGPSGLDADPRYKFIGSVPSRLNKDQSWDAEFTYQSTADDSARSNMIVRFEGSHCSGDVIELKWEMIPFLEDIDMDLGHGSTQINTTWSRTITMAYCNKTFEPIEIADLQITGSMASHFSIATDMSELQGKVLAPDECLNVIYNFSPTITGYIEADLVLSTAAGDDYNAIIFGNSSGNASIAHTPFNTPDLDCKTDSQDFTIELVNNGTIPLDVDAISMQNEVNLVAGELTISPAPPFQVNAGDTKDITLTFEPQNTQQKSADITIEHSGDGSLYTIPVSVRKEEVDFTIESVPDIVIDLGTQCIGVDTAMTLVLENIGNMEFPVDCTPSGSNIDVGTNWPRTITPGSPNDVDIVFSPDTEGPINATVQLVNEFCEETRTVTFTGNVANPAIDAPEVVIDANVGLSKQHTFKITNTSSSSIFVTALIPSDAIQFEVISPAQPMTPTEIPAQGTIDVTIQYTPNSQVIANIQLHVQVDPCGYDLPIDITGNPAQATAKISMDQNYTGVSGSDIVFDIDIVDPDKFVESGSSHITTFLTFDGTLLTPMSGSITNTVGNDVTVQLDFDITPQNSNMDAVYQFLATVGEGDSGNLSTDMVFSDTKTELDNVFFSKQDGQFTLNPSQATLTLPNLTKRPGDSFKLPIMISNVQNITPEDNTTIEAVLTYNAMIMEPRDKNLVNASVIDGDNRVITLVIPIPAGLSASEQVLIEYPFKAMLGSVTTSDITLDQLKVTDGFAQLTPVNGSIALSGLCSNRNDGSTRLYSPNGVAGLITPTPNPAGSNVELQFSTKQKGHTEIWISDVLGNKVKVIYSGTPDSGDHSINVDLSQVSGGMYYIMMQTPTRQYARQLHVIK